MRIALLALGLMALPLAPATAYDRLEIATSIGNVLASEERCGLAYEQAIAGFIETSVAYDDLTFPALLSSWTQTAGRQLERMSPSAVTAHCTQIRRIAHGYGFLAD